MLPSECKLVLLGEVVLSAMTGPEIKIVRRLLTHRQVSPLPVQGEESDASQSLDNGEGAGSSCLLTVVDADVVLVMTDIVYHPLGIIQMLAIGAFLASY